MLGHEGFRVQAAPGGLEALEMARKQAYDLVISDVRMPGMDGSAVVLSLRELLPEAHSWSFLLRCPDWLALLCLLTSAIWAELNSVLSQPDNILTLRTA